MLVRVVMKFHVLDQRNSNVIARCGFHRGDPLVECFVCLKSLDTKWIASSQAPRNDVAVSLGLGSEFHFVFVLLQLCC